MTVSRRDAIKLAALTGAVAAGCGGSGNGLSAATMSNDPAPPAGPGAANSLWGGRFGGGPSAIMQEINASIGVDKRLWREDIQGSRAHVAMLGKQGIVSAEDAAAIDKGLQQIAAEYAEGRLVENKALEDIHLHVETRLKEIIGPAAGRLHTARSRNDQVAVDFRLWVKAACAEADMALKGLITALLKRAEEHADTILPGFTHLQVAQPVTLGHHLMAYVEMLGRDRGRFADARARMDECPLGAAAPSGHSSMRARASAKRPRSRPSIST